MADNDDISIDRKNLADYGQAEISERKLSKGLGAKGESALADIFHRRMQDSARQLYNDTQKAKARPSIQSTGTPLKNYLPKP